MAGADQVARGDQPRHPRADDCHVHARTRVRVHGRMRYRRHGDLVKGVVPWVTSQAPLRMVSEIFSAAATTGAACTRPGERLRRSSGPDTEMAAMTRPPVPRMGAETEPTPCSR